MPITIIVEDGSNVANANSYISIADARIYASNRGVALPSDDDELAAMLISATDYLNNQECEYQGARTYLDQVLSWPRSGVYIYGSLFPSDKIPNQLIGAQVQLAMAINSGIDIYPNVTPSEYVTEETVGPLTTKYADPTKVMLGTFMPSLPGVDALLQPLFGTCGQTGLSLRTDRV